MSPSSLHGWLNVNKPAGLTSNAVLGRIKRLLRGLGVEGKLPKIGHAGTLDPLASGVLPVAIGEATKTVPFLVDADKEYQFAVRWGEARNTDDADGDITARSPLRPSREMIEEALPAFRGRITQTPPAFSAVKVNGQRAYAVARKGEAVQLEPREVWVWTLVLAETLDVDTAIFTCACSKGTYVRALARDMGETLGCFGHITALRRTLVGKFCEKNAISLEKLEEVGHIEGFLAYLLPVSVVLDDIPAIHVTESQMREIRQGRVIYARLPNAEAVGENGQACGYFKQVPVAIMEYCGSQEWAPRRVFNIMV